MSVAEVTPIPALGSIWPSLVLGVSRRHQVAYSPSSGAVWVTCGNNRMTTPTPDPVTLATTTTDPTSFTGPAVENDLGSVADDLRQRKAGGPTPGSPATD